MRHRGLSSLLATRALLVVASLVCALPAAAEVYTIRLTSGGSFESRYQPKQAAWDASLVTFVDETGTEIALPQALIADVVAQSEQKGYGRVLNTTTVDLGFMPNDLDQSQQIMAQQAAMNPQGQLALGPNAGSQQFVEPSAIGNGIPMGFNSPTGNVNAPVGGVPGGFTAAVPGGTTAPPFTTPSNTVTPPPFTTPSPGTATAPTTTPQ
jgi:hypothetical protein